MIIKFFLAAVLGFFAYALLSTGWDLLTVTNVLDINTIAFLGGGVCCAWIALTILFS